MPNLVLQLTLIFEIDIVIVIEKYSLLQKAT
jgi:hypothetical protein